MVQNRLHNPFFRQSASYNYWVQPVISLALKVRRCNFFFFFGPLPSPLPPRTHTSHYTGKQPIWKRNEMTYLHLLQHTRSTARIASVPPVPWTASSVPGRPGDSVLWPVAAVCSLGLVPARTHVMEDGHVLARSWTTKLATQLPLVPVSGGLISGGYILYMVTSLCNHVRGKTTSN